MDIDELRTVQTKERQKDSLQHLRDSFYEDVAAYIQELKTRRSEAAEVADDPFSDPEVSQLTDEIETAEDVVEAVYERRVGKVVKLASFAAADMPVDEEGLTVQERDLFEDLVGRIGENKARVLDILAGEGDSGPAPGPTNSAPVGGGSNPTASQETADHRGPEHIAGGPDSETSADTADADESVGGTAEPDETPSRSEPAVVTGDDAEESDSGTEDVPPAPPDVPPEEVPPEDAAAEDAVAEDVAGEDVAPEDAAPQEPVDETESDSRGRSDGGVDPADEQRTTVRITADIGQLLGMDDREYDLRSEDVVSLPEENADALLQREAAEEL